MTPPREAQNLRHLMYPTRHNRTVFSLVLSSRRHNGNLWAALLTFGGA